MWEKDEHITILMQDVEWGTNDQDIISEWQDMTKRNYIGNLREIEGKNGQVQWSGKQACNAEKELVIRSKKGLNKKIQILA